MKRLFLIIGLIVLSTTALAKPQTLGWTWPDMNCDGTTLAASDLFESELIYDVTTMPMPSDVDGPCAASQDPDAPTAATVVPIPVTQNAITLNLMPGMEYYVRIRVSAYVDGNWSSWSTQLQFTVPYGKPNRMIWLN